MTYVAHTVLSWSRTGRPCRTCWYTCQTLTILGHSLSMCQIFLKHVLNCILCF